MAKLFANSGDPDQTLHSVASDLGLHCLPNTVLGVSRLHTDIFFLLLHENICCWYSESALPRDF